ncbi:hypothetical protein D083_0461 [Dickeya solani RNS 08.23.3.1.A]|nr:hypothetical protein D083_0461 [Dickeya solani RNS 08.23.3.1.A]
MTVVGIKKQVNTSSKRVKCLPKLANGIISLRGKQTQKFKKTN